MSASPECEESVPCRANSGGGSCTSEPGRGNGLPSIGAAFAGSQTVLDLIAVGYPFDLSANYAQR